MIKYRFLKSLRGGSKKQYLDLIEEDPYNVFESIPIEYRNDADIIDKLISSYGLNLQFLDDKYKSDINIVKKAISSHYNSYQYASENLRDNDELIKFALKSYTYD